MGAFEVFLEIKLSTDSSQQKLKLPIFRCSAKLVFLKISQNSQENTSLFVNKVTGPVPDQL